jgi:(S)-2-hydroxy-acid oxidase
MSTVATCSLEEVAKSAPHATKWFQIYIYKDRSVTKALVEKAEKLGFRALVLTVDVPVFGLRRTNMRDEFVLPSKYDLPHITEVLGKKDSGGGNLKDFVGKMFDPKLTWKDVLWLKE